MKIIDLKKDDKNIIHQLAMLLVEEFRENWPDAWPDLESGVTEVMGTLGENRINRAVLDEKGEAIGWIGGSPTYDGNVWELHPLVVRSDCQGKGIGKMLVADLEKEVRKLGGHTLWLGTDDENNQTSLGGVDLYPDVLDHLANIKNLRNHPFSFYQKIGFTIVGVMPDANGPGKPDIFMAKKIAKEEMTE